MICFHVTYGMPPEGAAFQPQRQWKVGRFVFSWFRGTPVPPDPVAACAPQLLDSLEEILAYDGGADNALEDRYVMERAHFAVDCARGRCTP